MAIWDNAGNQAMDPEGNVHITLDRSGGEDCPASGGAILYKEADFGCAGEGQGSGYLIRTLPGWQNLPSVLDDQASSLRVPPGWSVRLYEDVDRGGASVCRDADDADLSRGTYPGGGELDDTVSSWSVFDDDACGTDEGARWMYLPLAILDHR
jgi:hypothetical protein